VIDTPPRPSATATRNATASLLKSMAW
jgi:hypothetical protein